MTLVNTQNVLLVTYDLKAAGWNYSVFYEKLKSQGAWWHYITSSWLIITSKGPDEVYSALAPHLAKADRILILPVRRPAFGWLPREAWDWINTNLPT